MSNDIARKAAAKLNAIADECAAELRRRFLAELSDDERAALLEGNVPCGGPGLLDLMLAGTRASNEATKTA